MMENSNLKHTFSHGENGPFFQQLKRRSLDPVLLNQQTLELREHLHGPADIVLVAEEVRFAAHKSVLVTVRTVVIL